MQTPWGHSDGQEQLAEGIISYSTPSHGGIGLSLDRQKQLREGAWFNTDNFLHSLRWWEEDCDWVVPYIYFAKDIKDYGKAYHFEENLNTAREIAKYHYPTLA